MSDSDPSLDPRGLRPAEGFWPVVIVNAVFGLPAYFISFLFAYGFRDEVGLTEHMTFLVLIAISHPSRGLSARHSRLHPCPGDRLPDMQHSAYGCRWP